MRAEEISDAMEYVEEKILIEAEAARESVERSKESGHMLRWEGKAQGQKGGHGNKKVGRWIALAACAAVLVMTVFGGSGRNGKSGPSVVHAGTIAQAEYPEMAQYPQEEDFRPAGSSRTDWDAYQKAESTWLKAYRAQVAKGDGYETALNEFFAGTAQEVLAGAEGENRVYSPANVYMALCMLAELTEGDSRAQLLELLGVDDMNALRKQASAVWNSNYCDDGRVTSILANSIWLDEGFPVYQQVMDTLAEHYYASSYQGDLQSPQMTAALQSWINEQTGGLLKEQSREVGFKERTVMALASTLYFQARWETEFSERQMYEDVFHGAQGDVTCTFMKQGEQATVYWGEDFQAVPKTLVGGAKMWLILPEEGKTVEDLLTSDQVMEMVAGNCPQENQKEAIVHLTMPKFDVVASVDLRETLQTLGVTDVFDSSVSDFSAMTDWEEIFVSEIKHAARVAVDEEGCTAAAFTVIMMDAQGAWMGDQVEFVLDRPFLFVITGASEMPLFAGVVNMP